MASLHLAQEIFKLIYPVGSIYLCSNSNINPSTLFGGTWERVKNGYLFCSTSTETNIRQGYLQTDKSR